MNLTPIILIISLSTSCALAESNLIGEQNIDPSDPASEAFNFIDQNRSQSIDFNELYTFMMAENVRELQSEFKHADTNNDTYLSFDEASTFDATFEEFTRADEDRDSHVDFEEFIAAVLHDLFEEADLNQDDHIVFSEFKHMEEEDD